MAWNHGWGKCDLVDPDPDDSSEVEAYNEARKAWDTADKAKQLAESKLKDPICSLAVAFERSSKKLETLSRYETTIERRLRSAMQDLEDIQAAREAKAADAATVIHITDHDHRDD